MAETEFTQADIDSLGMKLERLELSDTERAVLSALLALATDRLRQPTDDPAKNPVVVHDVLPDFRTQLAQAFSPGAPGEGWASLRGGSIGPGARSGSIGPGG